MFQESVSSSIGHHDDLFWEIITSIMHNITDRLSSKCCKLHHFLKRLQPTLVKNGIFLRILFEPKYWSCFGKKTKQLDLGCRGTSFAEAVWPITICLTFRSVICSLKLRYCTQKASHSWLYKTLAYINT